jgi:hypothetical protein
MVDDNYKCFLHVRVNAHESQVVGIGNSIVASDVQSYETNHTTPGVSNNALLIDEGKDLLFMVNSNDNYSSIRALQNPITEEFEQHHDLTRQLLLNQLKDTYKND